MFHPNCGNLLLLFWDGHPQVFSFSTGGYIGVSRIQIGVYFKAYEYISEVAQF